jgi:thioredoxin-dependent peroxiredoxin
MRESVAANAINSQRTQRRLRLRHPVVMSIVIRFGILSFATLVACAKSPAPVATADSPTAAATSATSAPDFVAVDAAGKQTRLSEMRGSQVVVYFYPKDETPGCTKEACAFRDAFAKYTERGIRIVGISQDSEESHKLFREKHNLPFLLVADKDGKITQAYGVGSTFGMSARVTFLIGKDGKIARSWKNVDPGVHASEVLEAAAQL